MSEPEPSPYGQRPVPSPAARSFSPGRLWAAGFGTAVVAALIVVVGVMVVRVFVKNDLMAPASAGHYGDASTTTYALAAAAAALLATGLLHLLLVTMPRPYQFFSWIVGLATAAATLLPFTLGGGFGRMASTAAINLIVGLAILALLPSAASSR